MLIAVFREILKMNLAASVTAIFLMALKWILQKCGFPRKASFVLWTVIALRFLCPVFPHASFSVFHLLQTETIEQTSEVSYHAKKASQEESMEMKLLSSQKAETNWREKAEQAAAFLWLLGCVGFLTAGAVSWLQMKHRLRFSVKYREHIFLAEEIPSSFVFGLWKPKIYVPMGADETQQQYMIAHEQVHIRRKDSLRKTVAYLLCCLHWFQPLIWFLFRKFSEETELFCDELVLRELGEDKKRGYAETLFQNANGNIASFRFYTVGFSSGVTKRRIQNVMQCREASIFRQRTAVVLCALFVLPFCTDAMACTKQNEFLYKPMKFVVSKEKTNAPNFSEESAEDLLSPEKETKTVQGEGESGRAAVRNESEPRNENVQITRNQENKKEEESPKENKQKTVVGEYRGGESLQKNLFCDENGCISLFFQMNTECLMQVIFLDCDTGKELETSLVLADGRTTHVFEGFTPGKEYAILLQSKIASDWNIAGHYQINGRKDDIS